MQSELVERTEWALRMQLELEERTQWALSLDRELSDLRRRTKPLLIVATYLRRLLWFARWLPARVMSRARNSVRASVGAVRSDAKGVDTAPTTHAVSCWRDCISPGLVRISCRRRRNCAVRVGECLIVVALSS